MDRALMLRAGQPVAVLPAVVPLGRWQSASAVAALTADNVFDSTLYSAYRITGYFLPVTDNVSLQVGLRTSAPADLAGAFRATGTYYRVDVAGNEAFGPSSAITNNVGHQNPAAPDGGVVLNEFSLTPRPSAGERPALSYDLMWSKTSKYWLVAGGEFQTAAAFAGIKFSFSSGNVAPASWFQILGIPKQPA